MTGRLIVLRLPNGRIGPGLHIPGPGHEIVAAGLTMSGGDYALSVLNFKGRLKIRWSVPARVTRTVRPAADPACAENAFSFEGPFWANTGIATDGWFYNQGTASRAGLTVAATQSDLRQANTNLTHGINNCGFAEGTFNVQGVFRGDTSKFANINSAAKCTNNFPDGQNTVSWGPLDSSLGNLLAWTCANAFVDANGTPTITEADTYLGSNRNIVDSFPSPCSNRYDLQTVMTHEWGHAYGLAHVGPNGADEVMFPDKPSCNLRRHLGGGDWSGMASLYP